jgi:hypothetical protein
MAGEDGSMSAIDKVVLGIAIAGLTSALGACGGGDSRPDTGYGLGEAVPAAKNCADMCRRAADCAGHLCNEDKNTTMYTALIPILESICESSCMDAQLASITTDQWQCLFQDSCRQVFDQGSCGTANTSYSCE